MYNKLSSITPVSLTGNCVRLAKKDSFYALALLLTIGSLFTCNQAQALSLISEKCDPNKVGPDETTVKGGWQAEMFNGLSFRTCGKCWIK